MYYDVINNCGSTVGSIVISGTVSGVCPGQGVSLGQTDTFIVSGDLASTHHVGNTESDPPHPVITRCVLYTNGVPTLSAVPVSSQVAVSAKGINANGTPEGSQTIPIAVIW